MAHEKGEHHAGTHLLLPKVVAWNTVVAWNYFSSVVKEFLFSTCFKICATGRNSFYFSCLCDQSMEKENWTSRVTKIRESGSGLQRESARLFSPIVMSVPGMCLDIPHYQ